jgi:hypothetical protein
MTTVKKVVYLANWMQKEGFLKYKQTSSSNVFKWLKTILWKMLPINMERIFYVLPKKILNKLIANASLGEIE